MNDAEFLDTNVLVYAYDGTAGAKRVVAGGLIKRAIAGEILISAQVLAEFSVTLLHKTRPPARPNELEHILDILAPIRVVTPDARMVRRAVQAHAEYGIHFYDGMIVAAAERAGCARIWSEDLNHGQKYFEIVVENPFK